MATGFKNERLKAACQSTDAVLVMDNFPAQNRELPRNPNGHVVDMDGDGAPDLFHGELVETLVRLSGHSTERLNLDGNTSLPDLVNLLTPLVHAIETGEKSYSRINLSQENPLRIGAFKNEIFANDPSVPEVDAANIGQYAYKILERLWTARPDLKIRELYQIFERFEQAGVPIVVAAGNFGPSYINLFSMMPGVITVGSQDHQRRPLLTSADNEFVEEWRLGVVVPVKVQDGVDLNGDNTADVTNQFLTGRTPIVAAYHGLRAEQHATSISKSFIDMLGRIANSSTLSPNAAVNGIDPGLYKVEDLIQLPSITQSTATLFKSLGQYVLKIASGPPTIFFDVDEQGTLRFDPKGDKSERQLTRIAGTSFAAPIICQ
ncbi:MAG: S8/S53 family peptidase [Bdellovibrionales bacterium]|nr:S8/S53 family peptidase [Bdellovibrionales bacterium]